MFMVLFRMSINKFGFLCFKYAYYYAKYLGEIILKGIFFAVGMNWGKLN